VENKKARYQVRLRARGSGSEYVLEVHERSAPSHIECVVDHDLQLVSVAVIDTEQVISERGEHMTTNDCYGNE